MQGMYGVLVPPRQSHSNHALAESIPQRFAMTPPPDASFASRDELLAFVKHWAANQGYAVVIGRSRTNRLWMRCDRGGEYRDRHVEDPSARQRKRRATRITGCGFSIKASMRKDGIWRSRCECGEHNHGPAHDLREHPTLRRMTDEQVQKVNELTEAGKTPVQIMAELSDRWPGIKVIRRDIYNVRKNHKATKQVEDDPMRETQDLEAITNEVIRISKQTRAVDDIGARKRRRIQAPQEAAHPGVEADAAGSQQHEMMHHFADDPLSDSTTSNSDRQAAAADELVPSWTHSPEEAHTRPSIASPHTTLYTYNSTLDSIQAPSQSSQPEFTGTATSHLDQTTSVNYNHVPNEVLHYPQSILNTTSTTNYPLQAMSTSPPVQHQTAQIRRTSHIAQGNATPAAVSSSNLAGPDLTASRRPSQAHTIAAAPRRTSATVPVVPSQSATSAARLSPSNSSRPATSIMPATPTENTGAATPATTNQARAQGGAVMMQRMQRMEDELKEQKNMLNQILAVVQGLSAGGAGAGGQSAGSR